MAAEYQALYHVLHEMQPNQVVDAIAKSDLRGRGKAAYPTGLSSPPPALSS